MFFVADALFSSFQDTVYSYYVSINEYFQRDESSFPKAAMAKESRARHLHSSSHPQDETEMIYEEIGAAF